MKKTTTDEKSLDEMNILEMVDYFMVQGMTEEQATDLAHAEWQARTINDMSQITEPVYENAVSDSESEAAIESDKQSKEF